MTKKNEIVIQTNEERPERVHRRRGKKAAEEGGELLDQDEVDAAPRNRVKALGGEAPTNDAAEEILQSAPYFVEFTIEGVSTVLFHRYSVEAVNEKANMKKGSAGKKTDNVESYVYRDQDGVICLPGEYVKQCLVNTAKFRQDPRSPRKSMADLMKALLIPVTELAPIGTEDAPKGAKEWDYLDVRRVVVQRNAVPRTRPAFQSGWRATFVFMIQLKSYCSPALLRSLITDAGRLTGIGDYRPSYGRFDLVNFVEVDPDKAQPKRRRK